MASGGDPAAFPYDPEPDRTELRAWIEAETDPVLRQELLLGYFSIADPGPGDSALARRALAEIPPASLVWSMQWGGS